MGAMHPFHRTELLVGAADWGTLQQARALVVGLGGVGSYAAEAIVRAGFGHVTMVDFDRVCVTNVNRQLHATRKTVNQSKAELMAERGRAISGKCDVVGINAFFGKETADEILAPGFDVVLDCIDNMSAKILLLEACHARGMRVIAALGAGGRMDPTRVRVSDLSTTYNDPFARLVRDLLRQKGISEGIECVWSDEPPNDLDEAAESGFRCICPNKDENQVNTCESKFQVQGSNSWMPAIFGLTMAGVATNRLLERPIQGVVDRVEQPRTPPSAIRPSRSKKRELLATVGLDRVDRAPSK